MNKVTEGSLIAIPTDFGVGVAKVIFVSERYANTIGLKLYKKVLNKEAKIERADFGGPFDLYYTSLDGFKKKRWSVFLNDTVSDDERALTLRTAAGEVWVEDVHLRKATDEDLANLPEMLTHGYRLIEKYIGRYTSAEN
jgi:hypothetical protein